KSDTGAVSEAVQAQYIGEAYKRLFEEFPYVDALFMYNLRNNEDGGASSWANFGLMHRDFTAKPGYGAFKQAAATYWRTTSISVSPQTIFYGQSATVAVKSARQEETSVTLQALPVRSAAWQDVTSTATNAEGTVSIKVAPRVGTYYRAVLPALQTTTSAVLVKVRVRATAKLNRTSVRRRQTVQLSGRILVAPRGVAMLQQKRGARWVNVRRLRTSSSSTFSLRMRPYRKGRYYFRIVYYGDSSRLGATSRYVGIRVY
ncbi:MAG: hypothetical protein C4521_09190, partial [Actinobacteria bacterium]